MPWRRALAELPEAALLFVSESSLSLAQALGRFRTRVGVHNADPSEIEAAVGYGAGTRGVTVEDFMAPMRAPLDDRAPGGPPEA
jgi:hypothetical protein